MIFPPFQNLIVRLGTSSFVAPGQKQNYLNYIQKVSLASVKKCSNIKKKLSKSDKVLVKISTDTSTTNKNSF